MKCRYGRKTTKRQQLLVAEDVVKLSRPLTAAVMLMGIIFVAVDDVTGIGVADDFLFGPFGAGVGEGLIMIFG